MTDLTAFGVLFNDARARGLDSLAFAYWRTLLRLAIEKLGFDEID